MEKLKGRHIVFIVGFISTAVTSIWNTDVAKDLCELMILIGIGIVIFKY